MVGRAHHSRGRRYSQTSSFYLKRTYEKARTFEVACSKWFFLPYAALSLWTAVEISIWVNMVKLTTFTCSTQAKEFLAKMWSEIWKKY